MFCGLVIHGRAAFPSLVSLLSENHLPLVLIYYSPTLQLQSDTTKQIKT